MIPHKQFNTSLGGGIWDHFENEVGWKSLVSIEDDIRIIFGDTFRKQLNNDLWGRLFFELKKVNQ